MTITRSGRDLVKVHRFLLLNFVPDEHPIGLHSDEPPVRQVVPAEGNEDDRHTDAMSALDVVGLVRAVIDERGDQHDIGLLVLDEQIEQLLAWNCLFDQSAAPSTLVSSFA